MRYTQNYLGNTLPGVLERIEKNRMEDPLLQRIAMIGTPLQAQEAAFNLQYFQEIPEFREHPNYRHLAFMLIAKELRKGAPIPSRFLAFRIMHTIERQEIRKILDERARQGQISTEEHHRLMRLTDEGKTALLKDENGNFTDVRTIREVGNMETETVVHWNPFHLESAPTSAEMSPQSLTRQIYEQQALAIDDELAQNGVRRKAPLTIDYKNGQARTQVLAGNGEPLLLTTDLKSEEPRRYTAAQEREPEKRFSFNAKELAAVRLRDVIGMEEVRHIQRSRLRETMLARRVREQARGARVRMPVAMPQTQSQAQQQKEPQQQPQPQTPPQKPQRRTRTQIPRRNHFLRNVLIGAAGAGAGLGAAIGAPSLFPIFFGS